MTRSYFRAALIIARPSATLWPTGFSTYTSLPAIAGVDRGEGVPVVGRGDDDGVDVLVVEQLAVVAATAVGVFPLAFLIFSAVSPACWSSTSATATKSTSDRLRKRVEELVAPAPRADQREPDLVVRPGTGRSRPDARTAAAPAVAPTNSRRETRSSRHWCRPRGSERGGAGRDGIDEGRRADRNADPPRCQGVRGRRPGRPPLPAHWQSQCYPEALPSSTGPTSTDHEHWQSQCHPATPPVRWVALALPVLLPTANPSGTGRASGPRET